MQHATELVDSLAHALGLDRYLNQSQLQTLLSILISVALVLFGLNVVDSNPQPVPSSPSGSSETSRTELVDSPKNFPVDTERLIADQEIRSTMLLSLAEVRSSAGLSPLALSTSATATTLARNNAQAGAYTGRAVSGRGLLQAHLPSDSATAGELVTLWVKDAASAKVLAASNYTTVDIGVASANGQTWAVLILSA